MTGSDEAARDAALAEMSDAVCRMGSLMLTSGTGSYRVKAAMGRVAEALGIERLEAQVSLTEIVATTRAHGSFRTQVLEVPVPVVNADRIGALMRLSLRAAKGSDAAGLQRQLDWVERRPERYPPAMVIGGAAVACAAFALLNNGRWQELLAAGIAAAGGKAVQLLLRKHRLNQLAVVAAASTVACLIYMLAATAVAWALPGTPSPLHEAAFTSAILFLVPGFPLITAALDLARFDFGSGVSRLLYATLITLAAALGAWIVGWAFQLSPAEIPPLDLPLWFMVAVWLPASFFGVLGFAVTFNTPPRVALWAAGIGTVANVARLSAVELGWNSLLSAVAAAAVVGLLAGAASQRILSPRISLSVPAVLIMIPGASTFRALVAAINRDPLNAMTNALASLGVLLALATGLAIARMLTDPAWIVANPTWTQMPRTRAQRRLRGHRRD